MTGINTLVESGEDSKAERERVLFRFVTLEIEPG